MSEAQYRVCCHGGCLQNGTQQAQGYVSYRLETRSDQKQVVRLTDLPGVTTNNKSNTSRSSPPSWACADGSSEPARAHETTAWRCRLIPNCWSFS